MTTTVCIGCGLQADEDGALEIKHDATHGLDCDPTAGLQVYRSVTACTGQNGIVFGSDGGLWTPKQYAFSTGAAANIPPGSPALGGVPSATVSVAIANPSLCEGMYVVLWGRYKANGTTVSGSTLSYEVDLSKSGVGVCDDDTGSFTRSTVNLTSDVGGVVMCNDVIAAGATQTWTLTYFTSGGGGSDTVNSGVIRLIGMGVTSA